MHVPVCRTSEESLRRLVAGNCSMARFGDGEIMLLAGRNLAFQRVHPELLLKLRSILRGSQPGLLVGITTAFCPKEFQTLTPEARGCWQNHSAAFARAWSRNTLRGHVYDNSCVSRIYIDTQDRDYAAKMISLWRRVWKDRDVVIIEGLQTHFGAGNDLLDGAKSIRRILCPSANAYSAYNRIKTLAATIEKDALVLIALGPTATVLAADLHALGYRAIDIGHLDIEYEWYLAGAKVKQPVPGKLVYEARALDEVPAEDDEFLSQVVARIGV
ncbi:MAG: GT-D fold domain-containing protein [Oscillospiraceae bacterium]|jgi:glycosyltransferase family protein|nr:GT-D fold domain-containing protein [Oscillospiraceae bacterium]